MDSALRRLQKTADGKPLTIPMSLDASKFTTFEAALRGSIQHITDDAKNLKAALDSSLQTDNSANINRITEAMRSLEAAWKALPNNQKFDINDRLTPKAQEMVRQFNELATASSTYGQTLSQIAGKIKRAADEEAKANQKRNDGYAKLRKTLGAQENSIANLSAKIKAYQQILNSKEIGSKSFERVAEKIRKLTEQLDKAKAKVAELTGKAQSGATRQSAAVKQVSNEFKNQETYVSRLTKRMAVYASFSYAGNFLTSIREVTAQFELQRVSLAAILQDQAKAEALFSQIKSFALTSPVSILDLTKYTKQLAAYKIGYDELFETTKRLTDVSVGLGVSMDRIVLLYGQIRATGHLRASEVRQATEAGIPLVEELAKKMSETNGELVTAADVMDMISKRQISFEQVKEVFEDMTDKGGIFYNMQEKQGNTLYGLWAKLGDAASVMFDEMGNNEWVNKFMKSLIQGVTDLMRHWESWVNLLVRAGSAYLLNVGFLKVLKAATFQYTAAGQKSIEMSKAKVVALQQEAAAAGKAGVMARLGAKRNLAVATANLRAAMATNVFSKSWHLLKAAFMSNPFGLIITAITTAIALFMDFDDTLDDLNGKFSEINEKYTLKNLNDADNFKRLADAAVGAKEGSKEQREALEELNRTYGDIVGSENLQIDRLRAMKGEYAALTEEIEAYNLKLKYQEREDAYKEYYGNKKKEAFSSLVDALSSSGIGDMEAGEQAGRDIAIAMQDALIDELEKNGKATISTANSILNQRLKNLYISRGADKDKAAGYANSAAKDVQSELAAYISLLNSESAAIKNNSKARDEELKQTSKYIAAAEALEKQLQKIQSGESGVKTAKVGDKNRKAIISPTDFMGEYDLSNVQDQLNAQIAQMAIQVRAMLEYAGVEWSDAFTILKNTARSGITGLSEIDFSTIIDIINDEVNNEQEKTRLLGGIKKIQKLYLQLAPTELTERSMLNRIYSYASKFGVGADEAIKWAMKAGESLSDYRKRLEDESTRIVEAIARLELGMRLAKFFGGNTEESEKKIAELEKQQKFIEALLNTVGRTPTKGGGRGSDQRLQQLQEMFRTLKAINKEYDDLAQKEGKSKAGAWVTENYEATLKRLNKLAQKFNLSFGFPLTPESLQKYGKEIIDKINSLNLKGGDKAVIDLQLELAKDSQTRLEKDIEQQLKAISDRISRTKTAKEFYEKILGQTGDIELATRVSLSVYGSTGKELFEDTVRQIREVFKSGDRDVEIDLSPVFDMANQRIDYKALADIYDKYQDQIIEKNRSTAENIVKEGQKAAASNISTWEKELAKAKDYEEQRTDIINRETHRRAEIYKSNLPQEEKDRLAAQSQRKQDEDLAKVNFEEFTKSEDYIKIFENLDNVATSSLKRLRAEMQALIDTNQNLSPENMKTLVKAMEDIDEQISERGFGNDMIQSVSDYIAAIKNLKIAKQELTAAEAEYQAQLPQLDEDIATAEDEKVEAQRVLNDLKNNELATKNQIVAAELRLNTATANVAKAEQAKAKAADKVKKAEQKVTGEQDKQKKATTKFVKDLQKVASTADQLAGELSEIKDLLGISEDSAAGLVFDSAISSLQTMSTAINAAATAQAIFNAIAESNPYIAIAAGVLAVGSAIASWISGSKVRKANKEIERQQKLLDQLEYTYSRLQDAADRLFGTEYINNYSRQLANLRAQQSAYTKQAEAERSKGKKRDKEKIKDYENQARDTADKIQELYGELAAHFAGQSKTDAAKQMAQSWLEARASLSDTFSAIRGDYSEMIKNMIVEGAAARVIENALSPMWKKMEQSLADNDMDAAIDAMINGMDSALTQANNGMEVLWQALEARGYDMKKLIGDTDSEYTGIAKSVSGATSEEINNVAAIGNTLMYYVSPIPRIDENLARVVAIMEGRGAALPTASGATTGAVDYTDLFNTANQHLSSLPRMERHLAEIHTMLGRALRTKGATTGFNTFLNS